MSETKLYNTGKRRKREEPFFFLRTPPVRPVSPLRSLGPWLSLSLSFPSVINIGLSLPRWHSKDFCKKRKGKRRRRRVSLFLLPSFFFSMEPWGEKSKTHFFLSSPRVRGRKKAKKESFFPVKKKRRGQQLIQGCQKNGGEGKEEDRQLATAGLPGEPKTMNRRGQLRQGRQTSKSLV